MTFRKSLFWVHLVAGVICGVVIAVMCFTGVVLAFEKQLVAWSERDARHVVVPDTAPASLGVEALLSRVRAEFPASRPTAITFSSNPRVAVVVSLGRDEAVFVDPYTGALRKPASTRMHAFMHTMEEWHRFLALSGDQRPVGKMINGICNIAFFLLAVTGVYLWVPKPTRRSWSTVRARLLFQRGLAGKARDFNWHSVIGLWSSAVLIVLTLTAVPISFRWGNALVYRLVGETPPAQPGPPGSAAPVVPLTPVPGAEPLGREAQLNAVKEAFPGWEQITLRLGTVPRGNPPASPENRAPEPQPLTFTVKEPEAWPRTATSTAVVNPYTGELIRREAFSDQTAGRQLRIWSRFLHTGEALGWPGQLVAGLASLGGCVLVYTGFALSWRRFFGKRTAKLAH